MKIKVKDPTAKFYLKDGVAYPVEKGYAILPDPPEAKQAKPKVEGKKVTTKKSEG